MSGTTNQDYLLKQKTARLSVYSNTLLVVGKLIIGIMTGTVSIISEAIHSGVDLLASVIAFIAVKKSDTPPDSDHDYGHGKVENVSAAVEALLIIIAGLYIIVESVDKLRYPRTPEDLHWAILIMLISCITNQIISQKLFRIGEKTGSEALKADGQHLQSDVWTSAGVMVGLILMQISGFMWLDPFIAIAVAIIVLRVGYTMSKKCYYLLTDASLNQAEEEKIIHIILQNPQVLGYHKLRTRLAGNTAIMDFHLELPCDLPLEKAHAITREIETALKQQYGPCDPTIHIEPR